LPVFQQKPLAKIRFSTFFARQKTVQLLNECFVAIYAIPELGEK
jgi:hypothetical protein